MPPKPKRNKESSSSSSSSSSSQPEPKKQKVTKHAPPITGVSPPVAALIASSLSTQRAFQAMKIICQTWELVESKENHLGTLQLDLSPESSVSEWLLKDQDKHLAARLDKDETLPNLLLYANGFVHFATTATTAKDTAKDTTKESLQKGDYSSVGEGERNGGGCVAVFVSPTVVELRAEAGAP